MRLSRLLSLVPLADAVPRAKRSEPAPLLIPRSVSTGDLVANQYIVKFKESSTLAAVEETIKSLSLPNGAGEVFREVFTGFAGHFDAATLDLIRSHPEVQYVEQNTKMVAFAPATQSPSTWGLARISHETRGASNYLYDSSSGSGTCSYIVDSGIDASHSDFGGRVEQIKSFIGPNDDSCGHGTHVAGTIGSNTYGVAKKTTLLGIKVIDYNNRTRECEGPTIGILRGLEYVAQDVANRNCPKGVVVNMSLGGSFSQASNDAVAELVSKGFFVAVAAGNGDEKKGPMDAGDVSPASERSACTVGASDRNDRIAHFSNYGSMIDIHAPGVDIVSLKNGGGTALGSGTSMATPHVAGLAAYFMGQGRAAAGMCEFLQNISVKNAISGMHYDTKNLLAQNDRAR
ncbi:Proteinase K [Beauveria bassiana]|uniref:Subtilisin-like protease PR1G n=1 Tax=Beauveria bassiana (strain ARSEF 2860) TaxID=655819 RepID=J4KL88_BEAB2|nr:subtilisin-like protease PR1G [Beauveria bassiana ARSEF 2860]EJP61779.1 subtilisin-like protease PR1G [Beauveria bassiana ARSEF 2860]KAF1732429.1 Proteinase K [Beauveria bassiana]